MDVQKPTRDGETVGEGDTKGVITPEGTQEVKDASQEKPKKKVIPPQESIFTPEELKKKTKNKFLKRQKHVDIKT